MNKWLQKETEFWCKERKVTEWMLMAFMWATVLCVIGMLFIILYWAQYEDLFVMDFTRPEALPFGISLTVIAIVIMIICQYWDNKLNPKDSK